MIGSYYHSAGITVRYGYSGGGHHGWSADLKFFDAGFAEDGSTEGCLHTRYFVRGEDGLTRAIDMLLADAERLGIRMMDDPLPPGLWYTDDADYPAPDGWAVELEAQATRLGWRTHSAPERHPNAPRPATA